MISNTADYGISHFQPGHIALLQSSSICLLDPRWPLFRRQKDGRGMICGRWVEI